MTSRAKTDSEDISVTDAAREAVQTLERRGRLTPEAVVRAARAASSPLHAYFCWNDADAAHQYRLEQARALIRSVVIMVTIEDREISTVRYVRDPKAGKEQGYVSLAQLRSEPDTARAMLRMEFARAASALQRAEDLADALGLRRDVQAVSRKLQTVREKLQGREAVPA